jgi:catechol 2,3-dioxygenase-like lactoylglutathione lyase family enzyme
MGPMQPPGTLLGGAGPLQFVLFGSPRRPHAHAAPFAPVHGSGAGRMRDHRNAPQGARLERKSPRGLARRQAASGLSSSCAGRASSTATTRSVMRSTAAPRHARVDRGRPPESPPQQGEIMIRKLHHNAYRCRDSEQTRAFYEDFLGLPLSGTLEIKQTKSGRPTNTLHTFYQLDDGSYLAFFEAPDMPFEFKDQHDFDLHIALEVGRDALEPMLAKGKAQGIETRGVSDHGFIDSIYFRDPNGYVIELCAKRDQHDAAMDPTRNGAREILQHWTASKRTRSSASA